MMFWSFDDAKMIRKINLQLQIHFLQIIIKMNQRTLLTLLLLIVVVSSSNGTINQQAIKPIEHVSEINSKVIPASLQVPSNNKPIPIKGPTQDTALFVNQNNAVFQKSSANTSTIPNSNHIQEKIAPNSVDTIANKQVSLPKPQQSIAPSSDKTQQIVIKSKESGVTSKQPQVITAKQDKLKQQAIQEKKERQKLNAIAKDKKQTQPTPKQNNMTQMVVQKKYLTDSQKIQAAIGQTKANQLQKQEVIVKQEAHQVIVIQVNTTPSHKQQNISTTKETPSKQSKQVDQVVHSKPSNLTAQTKQIVNQIKIISLEQDQQSQETQEVIKQKNEKEKPITKQEISQKQNKIQQQKEGKKHIGKVIQEQKADEKVVIVETKKNLVQAQVKQKREVAQKKEDKNVQKQDISNEKVLQSKSTPKEQQKKQPQAIKKPQPIIQQTKQQVHNNHKNQQKKENKYKQSEQIIKEQQKQGSQIILQKKQNKKQTSDKIQTEGQQNLEMLLKQVKQQKKLSQRAKIQIIQHLENQLNLKDLPNSQQQQIQIKTPNLISESETQQVNSQQIMDTETVVVIIILTFIISIPIVRQIKSKTNIVMPPLSQDKIPKQSQQKLQMQQTEMDNQMGEPLDQQQR